MKTIVVASHKGGTGKTTTAVTLGHALARQGSRVLVVDLDPQGNVADFLGVQRGPGVYRLLVERCRLADVAVPSGRDRLDLVAGDHTTARAAQQLVGEPGLDYRLRKALGGAPYDWIILDTAPSLGLIQVLAFVAGDWLLVPTELNYASGLGVAQVLATVARLKQDVDLQLRLAGILPTKWDRRLTESGAQLKALAGRFPDQVWLPIPVDAKVQEAPAYGSTLWEYAPTCAAVVGRDVAGRQVGGYQQAVDRLLKETANGQARPVR